MSEGYEPWHLTPVSTIDSVFSRNMQCSDNEQQTSHFGLIKDCDFFLTEMFNYNVFEYFVPRFLKIISVFNICKLQDNWGWGL